MSRKRRKKKEPKTAMSEVVAKMDAAMARVEQEVHGLVQTNPEIAVICAIASQGMALTYGRRHGHFTGAESMLLFFYLTRSVDTMPDDIVAKSMREAANIMAFYAGHFDTNKGRLTEVELAELLKKKSKEEDDAAVPIS